MIEATEKGIGLEIIQLYTARILVENINEAIDEQDVKWASYDEEWNVLTGQDPVQTTLEHIDEQNIHPGHRPSLIENIPETQYPNISVMAYQARPSSEVLDQASNFLITIDIEAMIKGDSEPEVDRRIHRTTEAIHNVLVKNENLGGVSRGWENDPALNHTDIFTRNDESGAGRLWYWQGTRMSYIMTRHNKLP